MISPYLPEALLLAADRAARFRDEADAARLVRARRVRPSAGLPGPLDRLVARAIGNPWPTTSGIPQLRDYPVAAG